MKWVLMISEILACAVLGFAQTVIQHDVVHQNGAVADVFITQEGSFVTLNVSREVADASGGVQTFLFYDAFASNPDGGFTETFASGAIPSGTFQGDSAAHLILNVDTSQVPSFSVTTCTFTFFPQFTESCTPGTRGVIQLDWQQSHNSTTHSVTTQQQVFNQARVETNANSDTASAIVTGSFLGVAVDAGGQTGVNHNSTVEIFRFR